ncbi:unnamed protein product [Blepharisma stoltei]|uniref:Uncharacterized protein n=1 Tax=Blepharisma stoltei TaxID=1481888 RepID=A0AAU9JSX6_9CILI|nr:unnamed protein product [Blepharisma stoltei]
MVDKDIAHFISLLLTDNLNNILCDIIKLSSLTDSINLAASNAICILNRANFIFKNLDFSKIKIPHTDLSGSIFIKTNFEGSNLKGVNFSESKFYFCKFNHCDLTNAIFSSSADLYKQKSSPNNINISKDEKFLLTCSNDRRIRIWALRKNVILPEIGNYKHNVDWAELSPCGNYIAILSKEKGLELWDIKSKKLIFRWNYVHGVRYFMFSPYGRYIACNGNNFIQVYDLKDQSKCKRIKCISDCNIAFSQSGKILLYWSGQRVHETALSEEKIVENEKLSFRTDWSVQAIAFSPNDKYLALNGCSKRNNSIISLLNFQTKEFNFWLDCKEIGWVHSLSWSPGKNLLVSAHSKGTICLWDINNQKELALIRSIWRGPAKCKFSPSGKYIAFAEEKRIIKLWSIEKQKVQKSIEMDEYKILAISFSSCEKFIYQVTENYRIDRFDLKNQKWDNISNKCEAVRYASFSECRKFIAVGPEGTLRSHTIDIWDLDTKILYAKLASRSPASQLKFSFCGKFLISGHSDFGILWDLEIKEAIHKLKSRTYNVAWSPNGEYFATSDWNISILKFDQQDIRAVSLLNQWPRSLRFSECNKFLYSGDKDGSVIIWDFLKNQKIKILEGLYENANHMVACPNAGLLAVGGEEKIIVIWNIETGEKIMQFNTNLSQLNGLSITRSGKYIITGSIHKYVNCWKLKQA